MCHFIPLYLSGNEMIEDICITLKQQWYNTNTVFDVNMISLHVFACYFAMLQDQCLVEKYKFQPMNTTWKADNLAISAYKYPNN